MVASWLALVVGLVLVAFGIVGVRSAREIVRTQRREGMAAFADSGIDDETRTRVTRGTAIAVVAVGIGLVAYGVGLL